MKNAILILTLFTGNLVFGQQLQNPSFESWEVDNGKAEPENWSSIQTGDPAALAGLAPQVIFESSDAHTGSTSVKMVNASTFGIVANGIVTTGKIFADLNASNAYVFTDVSDPRWNSPLTSRPDSLVGWYKFEPMGADKGGVVAILHTGTAKIPDVDSTNYIGHCKHVIPNTTAATWTRFSIPFHYVSSSAPEYILINLTSGDETNAVSGSIAYFDDIELIYNPVGINAIATSEQVRSYGGLNQISMDLTSVNTQGNWEVTIYDVMGRVHIQQTITSGDATQFRNMNSGMYVCVLQNGNQVITKKVMVH